MNEPAIEPKYSIGIPEMDIQHARWIRLIERFRALAAHHMLDQAGLDAARDALVQLIDYTRTHFASEERFIAAHGYPLAAQHSDEHRELERAVLRLLDEIETHTTHSTPLKLNLLVTIWLMEHIMDEDKHYADFIRQKDKATTNGAPRPRPSTQAA